ncbi:SUKH-4 family immunity protein [Rhizomonospora bruguierae]|uniref:SUKH-4 family immunity protein n=1 Tax=Rhizomonospora bruguierae TaxID=1581705 RepID=UPI001BD01295|nr:SUKH-4 family immunity protein [Micromonospora sp. NBRC 107566]
MSLTAERIAGAFPDGDITTVPASELPDGLTNATARRVLTEVGVPEDVVGCVFFECADPPLRTLAEFLKGAPTPGDVRDDYLVAITDADMIALAGGSGECRFVPDGPGEVGHAANDLDALLAFFCDLRVALNRLYSDTPESELDAVEERLIGRLRDTDPAIAEEKWRWLIRRCIGEVTL